jgi:hypothetical protein
LPGQRAKESRLCFFGRHGLPSHFFLHRYTDSDVAIWDGLVTALSLLAQYLLAKKKIENWWVWLAVNLTNRRFDAGEIALADGFLVPPICRCSAM